MLRNYIAGQWQTPAVDGGCQVCDANTAQPLFQQLSSSEQQLEQALQAAAACHADNAWLQFSPQQRADALNRVADEILQRGQAIAEADAQATGVVISLTTKFVQLCAGAFRQAADLCLNPPAPEPRDGPYGPLAVERLPLGPAAVIAPWNAPAGIAAHKVASALAAACPVPVSYTHLTLPTIYSV